MGDTSDDTTLHLLLRLSRFASVDGRRIDIVDAHNEVIETHQKVALAKHGRSVSKVRIRKLCEQIEKGTPTFLVLAFRKSNAFSAFAAPLSRVITGRVQDVAEKPSYYKSLVDFEPSCWFILSDRFCEISLEELCMAKDGKNVVEVMGECRTSLMFVRAKAVNFIGAAAE
jgi:hypothetical protein